MTGNTTDRDVLKCNLQFHNRYKNKNNENMNTDVDISTYFVIFAIKETTVGRDTT